MSNHTTHIPASPEVLAEWQSHFTDTPTGDGLTCTELAEIAGRSVSVMRARLAAGVKNGTYIRSMGVRVKLDGTRSRVPVYALVKRPTTKKRK
jgi:hypothetical protein